MGWLNKIAGVPGEYTNTTEKQRSHGCASQVIERGRRGDEHLGQGHPEITREGNSTFSITLVVRTEASSSLTEPTFQSPSLPSSVSTVSSLFDFSSTFIPPFFLSPPFSPLSNTSRSNSLLSSPDCGNPTGSRYHPLLRRRSAHDRTCCRHR